MIKDLVRAVGDAYVRARRRKEYESQQFLGVNERPVELRFIFHHLARCCPRTVLDVGTGMTALPSLMRTCGLVVTAIDNVTDYWSSGMTNPHFHVIDDDITRTRLDREFDFITCVSTLEHIRDHDQAVSSMFKLLAPGGCIAITCPYNERAYVENVYALPGSSVKVAYPFVTQAYSRREVEAWLAACGGRVADQEYWQFYTGEYWTEGELICPPRQVGAGDLHQISCILLQSKA